MLFASKARMQPCVGASRYQKRFKVSTSQRRIGLVGLPNVGKSTLFNALTRSQQAEAQNFPFCTIEPNVQKMPLIDNRLRKLAKHYGSRKIVAHELEFVDIAGLVPGASQGAGMGNQFLHNVRDVKVIMHVLRCFENDEIVNTQETVDPVRDIALIETELILADLMVVEKRKTNAGKKTEQIDYNTRIKVVKDVKNTLEDGKRAAELLKTYTSEQKQELDAFHSLGLLSAKPMVYVCNVGEDDAATGNKYSREVEEHVGLEDSVTVSASIEAEAAQLSLEEEAEFLADIGLELPGLERISRKCMDMLGLDVFYSCGPEMSTAWLFPKGGTAEQCAAVIHTDIASTFHSAQIIRPEVVLAHKNEEEVIRLRKHRDESRDYIVKDGDIVYFAFKGFKKTKKTTH